MSGPTTETVKFGRDSMLPTSMTWTGDVAGSVSWTYDADFRPATESINTGSSVSMLYDSDSFPTCIGGRTLVNDSVMRTGDVLEIGSDDSARKVTTELGHLSPPAAPPSAAVATTRALSRACAECASCNRRTLPRRQVMRLLQAPPGRSHWPSCKRSKALPDAPIARYHLPQAAHGGTPAASPVPRDYRKGGIIMALRLFADETGWDQGRKDVRYTAAGLKTEPEHGSLIKPLNALLADWTEIDQARRDADDVLVDRHALVAAWDGRLDRLVVKLASRVLYECTGDRKHKTYVRYFPDTPSDVVRLGLESEIARTARFHDVAKELGASKDVKIILADIATVQESGKHALAQRVEAAAEVGRVSLRMHTWKGNANQARRSVENALQAYAVSHDLPRDYADDFFPPSSRKRTKAEPPAAPTTPAS